MSSTKIFAVFDSQQQAQSARHQLSALGLEREHINIVDQTVASRSKVDEEGQPMSFWAHIKAMFMPDEHRATIDESLRRGGYVLIATVTEAQHEAAVEALEAAGAVDLEEREAEWRSSGWMGKEQAAATDTDVENDISATTRSAGATGESIPVVQEKLRVGKREIERGGVRVRSFVVEEPVHEAVRLREERVEVERRPVNAPARPVAKGSPEDLLQERTVELSETAEQAVVGKEAVVTEEVRLRKVADERVEEIDDTVRHTEVEVDDSRAKADSARTPRTDAPRSGNR